jgi:hypothetical protein|tara:strand:- start:2034 stop:3341 length:1308 start_codon:yes stop_codon:yes gene_type:complete
MKSFENMKSFSNFVEAKGNTVVFSFGRMNPPSIGHQKLLGAIVKNARKFGGEAKLFVSYSQDTKKNPLSAKQRVTYIKKMFPKEMGSISLKDNSSIRTVLDVATDLNGQYENFIMVVGSDRVNEFKILLNKYNGVDAKHGFYKYKTIQIVSAGERDPDAEGVVGMSASKMRAAAVSGDYDSFKLGLPDTFKGGDKLFKTIRNAMGVTEELKPFKPVSEMNSTEFIREQYFQNLIYNVGDWVKDKKLDIVGEVVKRGTNYITIVQEDFSLHKVWLEDTEAIQKQHNKLPEAIDFIKNRNLWEKYQREVRNLDKKTSDKKQNDKEIKSYNKYTWGTKALTDKQKRITGQPLGDNIAPHCDVVKSAKQSIKELATKFKIPSNVAKVIYEKMSVAGLEAIKIQKYSTLLTTYINLMDEKIPTDAPTSNRVLTLKKKREI